MVAIRATNISAQVIMTITISSNTRVTPPETTSIFMPEYTSTENSTVAIRESSQRLYLIPKTRHMTAAPMSRTKKVMSILYFGERGFIYVIVQTLNMGVYRERDISRQLSPGWSSKFLKFLSELSSVGPGTAKKYNSVAKSLMKKRLEPELDDMIRYVKRKNRIYVRAAIIKFIDYLEHSNIVGEKDAAMWREKIPVVREQPPAPKQIPTVGEILKVIRSLDKEERLIARFMFFSGCRVHEALSVKLKDIDMSSGRVILYGKGRIQKKPRPVKIPMGLIKQIAAHVKDLGILEGETVFWATSGASLQSKVDMFNRILRKASMDVLGKYGGTHDLRRVVATRLLEETGGNLQLVQRILGHEKIETTMKYTKFVDREKDLEAGREIMEQLEENVKNEHR